MSNTLGRIFRLTTYGESHGPAIGGVIDGCPPGVEVNLEELQKNMQRRKPGQSNYTTPRNEKDSVELLSGVFETKTTGTSIGFIIRNENQHSKDYNDIEKVFRPSHADFTYTKKFGVRDHRGGGRSSARETANWIVGGTFAKWLLPKNIDIKAYVSSIGNLELGDREVDFDFIEKNPFRCPNEEFSKEIKELLDKVKEDGDTVGGTIKVVIKNSPIGLGEPIFDKLHARLAYNMMTINAVKGFEYGSGFEGTKMRGSEHNDIFLEDGSTKTNHSGGIQGGISNGQDIYFSVAFKPVASIYKSQETINSDHKKINLKIEGRHDPCVLPRAVPIVEAMSYLTLADFYLLQK